MTCKQGCKPGGACSWTECDRLPLDTRLDRAQADGRISAEDADEVRNFADFLAALPPRVPGVERTREEAEQIAEAYRIHYPEDYARALAEHQARQEATARD